MEERYAYEEAEKKLDAFAKRIKSRPFHRAYRKFKVLVKVFAYCDFSAPNLPTEEHLSWAWEDVELAFKGLGDSTLHGCIVQMWSCLSPQEKKFFLSTVKIGFSEAEAATGEDVARRYLFRYRRKPVRNPELGYNYQMTPPLQGVQLKNWKSKRRLTQKITGTSLTDYSLGSGMTTCCCSSKTCERERREK